MEFDFKNNNAWHDFLTLNNISRYNRLETKDILRVITIIKSLSNHELPNIIYNEKILKSFGLRDIIISLQGFALLDKEFIESLSEYLRGKKCLEIMSGCGALSKLLQDKGIDIIPTDNFSWDGKVESNWNTNKNYWTDIENIDCVKAIEKYGKDMDYIIMSWAYMDDNAYKCLLKMREVNPNCKMIYIGEDYGGCTANDDFFDALEEVNDVNFNKVVDSFKNWDGIYDYPRLLK